MSKSIVLIALVLGSSGDRAPRVQEPDWAAVERALGRAGQVQPGGVYRVGMPRSDLQVTVRGIPIRPALSLGSWIGFKPSGDGSVVMTGDLVLTESELNPVLARLQQGGIGQSAVHKHLPEHTPALWWTHVAARGNPTALAATVREALALTKTPPPAAAPAAEPPFPLDTTALRTALGRGGRVSGGVYQVSASRAETIRALGIEVPASMGVGTVINFQPTGGGRAVVNGDFAMIGTEVDSVVRALRDNKLDVVELHNHLVNEEPRLYFVHFFAEDDALTLARGLRAVLGRTNVR
jgi:hypothetical protein